MYENGRYKVWISGLSGIKEYDSLIAKLAKTNFHKDYLRNRDNTNSHDKMIFNNTYSAVIQVGAFVEHYNAIRAEKRLIKIIDHPITVIFEDGFYKVRINGFTGRNQALAFLPKLFDLGFPETYVVRVKQP